METSNCVQLNEYPTEATASKETCRLRNGLNENCLLKVFDYLRPYDLIQLCTLDTFFNELIINWTLKKKRLDLGMLNHNAKDVFERKKNERIYEIFQTFGKSMRKFTISTDSVTSLFEIITKYCKPATLTEIGIEIVNYNADRADETSTYNRLMNQSMMPFLSSLRKLSVTCLSTNGFVTTTKFLIYISAVASNLQILKLVNIDIQGRWLQNMQNLCELHLDWKEGYSFDSLISCLRENLKLKIFKFCHRNGDITTIGKVLSNCTTLQKFKDRDFENPYERLDSAMIKRYNFLATFPHLNIVSLTSYTFCGCDLYYPLTTMATKNIVKLKVFMSYSQPIILDNRTTAEFMRRPLPNFSGLQSLEIEIFDRNGVYDPKWTQCDLRCKFFFHFAAQLKNLQRFKFAGEGLRNMHKILEFAPIIRILDISQTVAVLDEKDIFFPNVVQTLRKIRQSNDGIDGQRLLHLIMNYEFKIGKNNDYEDVVRCSFKLPKP